MITIRVCSDWVRIYQDTTCLFEGHSIKAFEVATVLSTFTDVDYQEISDEEMEENY